MNYLQILFTVTFRYNLCTRTSQTSSIHFYEHCIGEFLPFSLCVSVRFRILSEKSHHFHTDFVISCICFFATFGFSVDNQSSSNRFRKLHSENLGYLNSLVNWRVDVAGFSLEAFRIDSRHQIPKILYVLNVTQRSIWRFPQVKQIYDSIFAGLEFFKSK